MSEAHIEAQLATLVQEVRSLDGKVCRVLACVDGDREEPGLRIRVDRLEQTESTRKWAIRAIASGLFALLVKQAHQIFTGRP